MSDNNIIELLCELTHAKSLQQICDLTYHITGNPAFISDLAHTILAYTKCVEVPDETWRTNIVEANLDRNTLNQDREVGSVHLTSEDEKRPVLVEDSFQPYPRIIKSLVKDRKAVGVMVVTSYLKPFDEHDLELVELISSFVIPCLMRESYHLSDDKHSIENFCIKLLDGESFTREQIEKRLKVLDFRQKPYTYVLAMCSAGGYSSGPQSSLSQVRMSFAAALHCPVFAYNTLLICVYGSDAPIARWPEGVPELEGLLEQWGLICGVSRHMSGLEELRDRYLQAQAVLDKGRKIQRVDRCYEFDRLSFYLLLDRLPREELNNYCHEQIMALRDYDLEHGTELCPTLQVYLEQAKSLNKTAELLFIHRNTVRYRVNRCMELLDNRLEDGNEIFAFILSLRILEYHAKFTDERVWKPGRGGGVAPLPAKE